MRFTGELDAETAATLEGLFGPLACPRGSDEDGRPDVRGSAERHGDALAEIIDCAARADELTVQGGEHAVLTATIEVTELQRRTRAAVLDLPGHTSLEQLRRLACHAKIVPAIYNATGEILHLGRAARSATPAQRRALGLRDRGCASPAAPAPPNGACPTTSPGGPTAAAPTSTILCWSAPTTTGSCTTPSGTPATTPPTGSPNSSHQHDSTLNESPSATPHTHHHTNAARVTARPVMPTASQKRRATSLDRPDSRAVRQRGRGVQHGDEPGDFHVGLG
ncbi:DUF222 domain-containing protein [Qaidamihabitans albus]|uniref:DUF222 domain-containing protein n=1 Tax=Qaidamihabitans albus TaxID=2795733 RepID=UPI0022A82432|nr:DUF222 domain-containing protein [Qaidamihabitans albus]